MKHAGPSASVFLPKDHDTLAVLRQQNLLPRRRSPHGYPVSELLTRILDQGLECRWVRCASYLSNEGILQLPLWSMIEQAGNDVGFKGVFQFRIGMTRELWDGLADLPCTDLLSIKPPHNFVFHPKIVTLGLGLNYSQELRIAWVGSGNLTYGGLWGNYETAALHAEVAPLKRKPDLTGWKEVDQILDTYFDEGLPIDPDLLPENRFQQRQQLAELIRQPESIRLRDYQLEASQALQEAYRKNRKKSKGKRGWNGAMLSLPPATGKTMIALHAVGQLDLPLTMWLSHSPLLARQAFHEYRDKLRPFLLQEQGYAPSAAWLFGNRASMTTDLLEHSSDIGIRIEDEHGEHSVDVNDLMANLDEHGRLIVFASKGYWTHSSRGRDSRISTLEWVPELVVVDEAHHAVATEWNAVLKELGPELVFGLTATPYRGRPESKDTRRLLNAFSFGDEPWLNSFRSQTRLRQLECADKTVAYAKPVSFFYRSTSHKILAVPHFNTVQVLDSAGSPIQVNGIGRGTSRIRFLDEPLSEVDKDQSMSRAQYLAGKVDDPRKVAQALDTIDADLVRRVKNALCGKTLAVVFARNTAHATMLFEHLRRCLPHANIDCIHSKDDKKPYERRRNLAKLQADLPSALVCVDMLSEGIDMPRANLIIVPRWTRSERLFWQIIGRGLRGPDVRGTETVDIVMYELDFNSKHAEDFDTVPVRSVDATAKTEFGRHAAFTQEAVISTRDTHHTVLEYDDTGRGFRFRCPNTGMSDLLVFDGVGCYENCGCGGTLSVRRLPNYEPDSYQLLHGAQQGDF